MRREPGTCVHQEKVITVTENKSFKVKLNLSISVLPSPVMSRVSRRIWNSCNIVYLALFPLLNRRCSFRDKQSITVIPFCLLLLNSYTHGPFHPAECVSSTAKPHYGRD